jgi:hypothetical protein
MKSIFTSLAMLTFPFLLWAQTAQTTLIPLGSEWKYLDDGSNQDTAWRDLSFSDDGWKTGLAELGYGENDAVTTVSYGSDPDHKYITTYFRKTIDLVNKSQFTNFTATIFRDDGAVVYVNGKEVYRTNMLDGTITYQTAALSAHNDDGDSPHTFTIDTSVFKSGSNVIAVEVHQSSQSSSDISFDFELIGVKGPGDNTPPVVNRIDRHQPTTTTTSASSVTFEAIFSEAVTGVDVTDFSITADNTVSGTISTVVGSGSIYDITVSSITGTGTLRLDIKASGTGITDLAGNALSGGFTTGETYSVSPVQQASILINSGGTQYVDGQGRTWLADTYFSGGKTGVKSFDVTGTTDDALYLDYRFASSGTPFSYNIPVAAGTYNVTLYFMEPFFGAPGEAAGTIGARIFNVSLEGQLLLSNFDIYAQNGAGKAVVKTFNAVSVADGTLNILFTSVVNNAIVSAIEINPSSDNTPPTDVTPPNVVSVDRYQPTTDTTSGSSVTYQVTFSEAVSGVDNADFTLTTTSGTAAGSIASTTGSGSTYQVTVSSITGTGTLRLDVKSSATGITDAAGNPLSGGFTTGETYTILAPVEIPPDSTDVTPPDVTSIVRYQPATDITSATSVTFRATFSEPVTGIDVNDFSLTTGGTVAGTISAVAGSGSVYDITVSNITGTGTLRLDVKSTGTNILDAADNALTGGFISGQVYTIQQTTTTQVLLTRGPYLQMASQSAVTLRWRTDLATDSKIEVGTSYGSYTLAATNPALTTEHEVRISGLNADTRYFYRFGSSSQILQSSANNFFNTAPSSTSTKKVRVAAFGDCGQANTVQANVLNAYLNYVGSNPAELMFLLGDNAYDDGTDAEYQSEFFDRYSTTILKNHVLFPAPGNHDYHTTLQTDRTAPYYKNFTVPTAAECGGVASGTKSFYSFDWGNVHFISLDSYGQEADNTRIWDTLGPQVTWVKKDLAANTKKWTIAFWHHPPFTMGTHNSDTENDLTHISEHFIRILERYGVDIILCAHSHVYERSYLLRGYYGKETEFDLSTDAVSSSSGKYNGSSNSCPYVTSSGHVNHGTVYVVSGSASRSGAGVQSTFPHDALPFATTNGGMFYMEVEDNRLDAKMIDENGSVFDQFTILKDVDKTNTINSAAGQQQQLTASWIGNYKWSTGATTRTITVAPQTTTTYTVTDDRNCLKDVFEINTSVTTSTKANREPGISSINHTSNVLIASNLLRRGEKLTIYAPNDNNSIGAIYNDQGQLIRTIKMTGTTTIETSFLPAGVYVLAIKNRNDWYKQRFVIRN